MELGQWIEYIKKSIFLQKLKMQKIKEGDYFQTTFCFLKKTSYAVKASGLQLCLNIFNGPQLGIQQKANYKTLGYWSRDLLSFNFSEEGQNQVVTSSILKLNLFF